ncbi:hypothetical protein ACFQ9U_13550 [Streptomyces sp. NPDC056568]
MPESSGERRNTGRTWTDRVTAVAPWFALIASIAEIVEKWVVPLF